MKIWKWALFAVIFFAMSGLVACGGDDDEDGSMEDKKNEAPVVEPPANDGPKPKLEEEYFFQTKSNLAGVLTESYESCFQFETAQLALEGKRVDDKTKVHSLNPYHENLLHTPFSKAYETINLANKVMANISVVLTTDPTFTEEEAASVSAHSLCLRAFAYYNLAMLWGDIVIVPMAEDVPDDTPIELHQSPATEVFQASLSDVKEAIQKLSSASVAALDSKWSFTLEAALMLQAEIELTLGYSDDALTTLGKINGDVSFSLIGKEGAMPVYTSNHLSLMKKEAQGQTAGLESEWAPMIDKYGYWAALKRLQKAQEVTGCYDYELLMPFADSDLRRFDFLKQNPGY